LQRKKAPKTIQYISSTGSVVLIALTAYFLLPASAYHVVAYLLLADVSLLAMLFPIRPVLLSAVMSALIWNFLFIPPVMTFEVRTTEDLLLLMMYFAVALVNAVLTMRIRRGEQKVRDREEKDKTIRLYNTLLNSLSHELRTPIATIIGSVDTLRNTEAPLTREQQLQLLEEIDIAGIRLNGQVENLLHMSRLETGMLHLKADWCDMQELVYLNLEKCTDAERRRTTVSVSEPLPLFRIDAGLMEQVLYNLIHNTFQHTVPATRLHIHLAHVADQLHLTVEDNGNGFPEEEIEQVFDKFYRLRASKPGGTGLGLSIAKGFVEAHNGSISLQNITPHGARFDIRIPCSVSYIANLNHE
jgi:two-component system, OmpR family, sensor histidine kinase KdpD